MADVEATAPNTQEESYADTPAGWAQRWRMEFAAARKEHDDWQSKGSEIVDRYLDKRKGQSSMPSGVDTRWNFFTANVQTMECMLYGRVPAVDVRPRFADAPDSQARVASELLERLLNSDIEREGDGYAAALGLCLKDRLLPGIAFMRLRYCADWEDVEPQEAKLDDEGNELAPAVEPYQQKSKEEVETDYVHWRDVLYSPCRTFHEMRWCAFRVSLTKEDLKKKFGPEVGEKIALDSKKDSSGSDSKKADPWSRADLWEIQDKEHKCRWYFVEGHKEVLRPVDLDDAQFNENGSQKDALGLEGFWDFPRPMVANLTTSAFLPRPDFTLCQDLYDEIDRVSTRITELERAIGAKGIYDRNASDTLGRLLNEDSNNKLLPVEGWAGFMEKGGIGAAFQLLPLDGIIAALDRLCSYRQELIAAANQLTGMSDIVRGEASEVGTTATEQRIKAKFASVRMQALQDEFARFATDGQKIRAEIIAKHFEPETILKRSNILHSFDGEDMQVVQGALALIKDNTSCYRVEVKPEAVSMTDMAAMKQERMEVITALGAFVQSVSPMVQLMPSSMPFLLELLQFAMQSFRGGEQAQGILERAKTAASQAQQQQQPQGPPQPDPKLLAAQAKSQADMQKIQAQAQSEMMRQQAETQELAKRKLFDTAVDIKEAAAKKAIQNGMGGVGPMPAPGQGGMP
jgi:hypothetical protein